MIKHEENMDKFQRELYDILYEVDAYSHPFATQLVRDMLYLLQEFPDITSAEIVKMLYEWGGV